MQEEMREKNRERKGEKNEGGDTNHLHMCVCNHIYVDVCVYNIFDINILCILHMYIVYVYCICILFVKSKCYYAKMKTAWLCVYCETEKLTECVNATERVLRAFAIIFYAKLLQKYLLKTL